MDAVIEATGLKKTYRRGQIEAVRGIDLKVHRGSCFGLLGPNGAGKSTTLEMLQGILPATAGELRVFGLEYGTGSKAIRKRMGGILQENKLYGKLKVREALELFQSFYDTPLEIEEVLSSLALEEISERYLKNLSGGQRQRVFLGTVLVGDPELVFLDEPTTGLDPSTRQDFWALIQSLKAKGKTLVLTTHYMDEAEVLCDDLAVIDQGRIIEQGSPEELIERVMRGKEIPQRPRRATLNDVFLTLTGRALNDTP